MYLFNVNFTKERLNEQDVHALIIKLTPAKDKIKIIGNDKIYVEIKSYVESLLDNRGKDNFRNNLDKLFIWIPKPKDNILVYHTF